jgi:hypothetical protein
MLTNLLARVAHFSSTAVKGFMERRASVQEIDSMDAQDRNAFARDLGISAGELRVLAGHDKSAADLLVRRMQVLGFDPRDVDPAVMRDLQRCCSQCTDKGLCIHELEDGPRNPTWPQYCPNKLTLAALKEERSK